MRKCLVKNLQCHRAYLSCEDRTTDYVGSKEPGFEQRNNAICIACRTVNAVTNWLGAKGLRGVNEREKKYFKRP